MTSELVREVNMKKETILDGNNINEIADILEVIRAIVEQQLEVVDEIETLEIEE